MRMLAVVVFASGAAALADTPQAEPVVHGRPFQEARAPDADLGVPLRVPKQVDEFMAALESDTTGYYMMWVAAKDPRMAETFLRGAQKQAPGRQRWAGDPRRPRPD